MNNSTYQQLTWGSESELKELIENGLDVNKFNKDGVSLLNMSCFHKMHHNSRLLINSGADVNQKDIVKNENGTIYRWNSTAIQQLLTHADNNSFDILKLLIEAGADLHVKDHEDNNLYYIYTIANFTILELRIFKILKENGLDISKEEKEKLLSTLEYHSNLITKYSTRIKHRMPTIIKYVKDSF